MVETKPFRENANYRVCGTKEETVHYAAEHFIKLAKKAIMEKGKFFVALAGGSTPRAIYQALSSESFKDEIAWNCVYLFWSDERCVSHSSPESNYCMAMDAGLNALGIPENQIYPMQAESQSNDEAKNYEEVLRSVVGNEGFDLMMLGMGDDGHTASLFPDTEALDEQERWVILNEVPAKKTWRFTMTYPLINHSKNIVVYVMGKKKSIPLQKVRNCKQDKHFPVNRVGTSSNPALWILDESAASAL